MSRIGRLPIEVPSGVDIAIDGQQVSVKGPKGSLSYTVPEPLAVAREDGTVKVTRPNDEGKTRALHGLSRTLIANMVTGVTDGYRKTLEIVGVGYRVQPPDHRDAPRGHQLPRRGADQVRGRGHRQAAGGRDRGQDSQAAQA
jgi:ribosomal protein L6P/L9E